MRLLYVNTQARIAGAENSLLLLIAHLKSRHAVGVACPSGPLATATRRCNCRWHDVPHSRRTFAMRPILWLRLSIRVWRIVKAESIDIVHANNRSAVIICLLAACLTRARLVWHARDAVRRPLVERLCGRLARLVIAVSHSMQSDLVSIGIPPCRIRLVYNGLDFKQATALARRRRRSKQGAESTDEALVFANVGQFVPWKNQVLFLAAAGKVLQETKSAQFWLVGEDVFGRNRPYVQFLIDYVKTHGLSKHVQFMGWQKDMSHFWAKVGCLVHTAVKEPFGRVIIEAMAAGAPVIAADSWGPGEIIEDEVTGLLTPPENVDALAEAMLRFVRERSVLGPRLAAQARQAVKSRFDARKTAECVERAYAEVMSDG